MKRYELNEEAQAVARLIVENNQKCAELAQPITEEAEARMNAIREKAQAELEAIVEEHNAKIDEVLEPFTAIVEKGWLDIYAAIGVEKPEEAGGFTLSEDFTYVTEGNECDCPTCRAKRGEGMGLAELLFGAVAGRG